LAVNDLEKQHNLTFDVAVFDCDGCFALVMNDHAELIKQLKWIIVGVHEKQETETVAMLLRDGGWQMVDGYPPVMFALNNTGMTSPVRETEPITWMLTKQCQTNCIQACHDKGMSCDNTAYSDLRSLANVKSAFKGAAVNCTTFTDTKAQVIMWDGPWLQTRKKDCGYTSDPRAESLCGVVAMNCAYQRLCPCF